MRWALIAIAAGLMLPASATARGNFSGPARAVDGDSLSVAGLSIRLHGIDAPELAQTCDRAGSAWACGEESRRQLQALIEGKRVECRGMGFDDHNRTLAVCTADGVELNRAIVAAGWATAFRKFSLDYVPQEEAAKAARAGFWDSVFVPPADFRSAHRPAETRQGANVARAPRQRVETQDRNVGCTIKGNHSRKGELIYHLPGQRYYQETRAERMFCTEAAARAAGFRRSRARW